MQPFMEPNETEMFTRYLKRATHYFEWGCGGSTFYAATFPSIQTILSIENDVKWSLDVQTNVPRAMVKYINTGPVNPGGGPKDEMRKSKWHEYYNAIKSRHVDPDLVLVDGRWRVACALTVTLECPSAVVLVHDYSNRPSYHILNSYFDTIEETETLVAFRAKPDIDHVEVLQRINDYKYRAE
jgi:hypothetical protein